MFEGYCANLSSYAKARKAKIWCKNIEKTSKLYIHHRISCMG
jgi:hypothetical protein